MSYILRGTYELWDDSKRADLEGLDFSGADLRGAIFWGACCRAANFTEADLRGADLRWAWLTGANFTRANLSGANMAKSIFHETIFNNTNMSGVVGLEDAYHHGPSSIDQRTLQQSGLLPSKFLRKCGVRPEITQVLATIVERPPWYYSCFISYASSDEEFARLLHEDFQKHSVRTWFAPEDLKTGAKFRSEIDHAIKSRERLLLVLSKHSISSAWVEKEVETAFEEERIQERTILFPVRLDDTIFDTDIAWAADVRRTRHIADFSGWKDERQYYKAFYKLLEHLRANARAKEAT